MRLHRAILLIGCCCLVQPAWGQQAGSPRRYVEIPFNGDLETMLRSRLIEASDWEEFLKTMPPALKRLPQIEQLKDDKLFRDLLRMLQERKLDAVAWPKDLRGIEKIIRKQMARGAAPPALPGGNGQAPPKNMTPMPPPVPTRPPPRENLETRFDRWLKDRLRDLDSSEIADLLQESPIWRKTIDDLGRSLGNVRPNGEWDLPGVLAKWPLADQLKLPDLGKWLRPPDWSMPDVPRPRLRLPGLQVDNPLGGMPLPAMPGARGLANAWQIALWAMAALAAAFILWLAWRSLERRGRQASPAWQPGPWPVLPAAVASRADVVACFQHLSLFLFGKAAAAWNHRAVAARLAALTDADAWRRQIAVDLAAMYEWARYAPGDEPMPQESLAEARAALAYFARLQPIPGGK